MKNVAEFDQFADSYDDDLSQALSVSGEGKEFFARGRPDVDQATLQHAAIGYDSLSLAFVPALSRPWRATPTQIAGE